MLCLVTQSSPPGSSVPGDSPGNNTEMGCHGLLQGIFPTQGQHPGLPHFRQISYFFFFSLGLGFFFFFNFYFIFKLHNIILVLPNIEMNLPQVYPYSPSWTLLPPHTFPLGHPSAPAPSIQYRAPNLDWRLISYMILYMFQCHSPNLPTLSLSHRVHKTDRKSVV